MIILKILGCVPSFVACFAVTIFAACIEWVDVIAGMIYDDLLKFFRFCRFTVKLIYAALKEATWSNAREIAQDYKAARHEERCAARRERRRKEAINV